MESDAAEAHAVQDELPPSIWPACRAGIYAACAVLLLSVQSDIEAGPFGLTAAVFFLALGGRAVRLLADILIAVLVLTAAAPDHVLQQLASALG